MNTVPFSYQDRLCIWQGLMRCICPLEKHIVHLYKLRNIFFTLTVSTVLDNPHSLYDAYSGWCWTTFIHYIEQPSFIIWCLCWLMLSNRGFLLIAHTANRPQGNHPIPSKQTCCGYCLSHRMQTMLKCIQTSAVRLSSLQSFYRQQVRKMSQSFYDFTAVNLKGEEVSFSKYKGKVVLIENVASLWGTTVRDYTQVWLYLKLEVFLVSSCNMEERWRKGGRRNVVYGRKGKKGKWDRLMCEI